MCAKYKSLTAVLCMVSLSLNACSNSKRATTDNAATVAALTENLSAADKLDGTEDHIVSKCYSCALGMDGASDITSKFHDYTVHHCSEACKERFTGKADSIVSRTKVPEAKTVEARTKSE